MDKNGLKLEMMYINSLIVPAVLPYLHVCISRQILVDRGGLVLKLMSQIILCCGHSYLGGL